MFGEIVSALEKNHRATEKFKHVDDINNLALLKLQKSNLIRYVLLNQEEFNSSRAKEKKQRAVKGYLFLEIKKGFAAAHVDISFLTEEFRGLGIGKKIYERAVLKDDVFLMSGRLQTPLSQRLWKSLAKNKNLFVWAQDLNSPRDKCQVQIDEDEELHCQLNIWYNDKTYWENRNKDIRLFAIPTRKSRL